MESYRDSIGDTNIMFGDGLVAALASIITLHLRGNFSLALWAPNEVHLTLVIIKDSLDIARELKVLGLSLATHH